jgi:hypothetical protein
VPLGVGVGLAGGLGVAAGRVDPLVAVGVGVPDGAAVPPGVARAVGRLDGVADGRAVDGSGSAGWVVEWPDPGAGAARLGRTYR